MNGWEFAKYFVDMAYQHWCITAFFIFLIFPKGWIQEHRTIEVDYENKKGVINEQTF